MASIYSKSLRIKKKLEYWNAQYKQLQMDCEHPRKLKTAKSDTGNWDRSQDSYWYEIYCPDCDKHWTEPQSV